MNTRRNGFTLVELLVVTVLSAFLLLAVLQTLIANQRTYTVQSARIQGQQASRAAMDVLFNELREISAQGGDLVSMNTTQVRVRAMRKFGVVCALTTTNPPVLRVLRTGDWFETNDSVFVFADNITSISQDDAWISARITGVDTTVACGASPAQNLSFSGQGSLFTADSVRTGASVRSYVYYTYGLITYDGQSYLGRSEAGGSFVPLVGPLDPSSGLRFSFLDSLGSVTAVSTDVRQIDVTVRTTSGVLNSKGDLVSDSITARVYTRN